MPYEFMEKSAHYDGMGDNAETADWLFFGAPFDGTSTYRAGSRFAPEAVRQETVLCQEQYSPYFDVGIDEKSIADIGNLSLPYGNTQEAMRRIFALSQTIISAGKRPLMFGGEHLVSLPCIQAVYERYPDLRIIHLDAHADMIDNLFGEKYSHGTVMRRVYDILGPKKIYQFGIRSAAKEEFRFCQENNFLQPFNLEGAERYRSDWETFPIYLSIDLDCFDPSQLPGTGTPETGGVFFNDFITFLKQIQGLHFVGIDINELAPRIDSSGMSTVFACKVLRETIAACL